MVSIERFKLMLEVEDFNLIEIEILIWIVRVIGS